MTNSSNVSFMANLTLNQNLKPSIKDNAREFKNKIFNPLKEKLAGLPNTKDDELTLSVGSHGMGGTAVKAEYKIAGEEKATEVASFPDNILLKNAKEFIERVMDGVKQLLHKKATAPDNAAALKEMGLNLKV